MLFCVVLNKVQKIVIYLLLLFSQSSQFNVMNDTLDYKQQLSTTGVFFELCVCMKHKRLLFIHGASSLTPYSLQQ